MTQVRYDQRVRVFVEVCGGEHDWGEAERCFGRLGWPVRGEHPAGEGPLGAAVEADPDSRVYEIEVRLFGVAKECDRGAADRVRKALRGARLEGYVRRAEHLVRDRELYPYWRVVRVSGARRRLARVGMVLGRHDVGVFVSGAPRQALRLARVGGAGGREHAVRPLDGRWREAAPYQGEEQVEGRVIRLVLWAFLAAGAVALAFAARPSAWWFLIPLASVGAGGALRAGWELGGEDRRVVGVGAALLCLVAFGCLGVGVLGEAWSPGQTLMTAAVCAVLAGLWLLVRQWTWGEWVAWAVPLVVTLAVSAFIAAGSVLHALYADGLGLTPDDLGVPPVWQAVAAVKLLVMLSLVMVVPAWWGFAKHRHHRYATPGDGTNVLLNIALFLAMLLGAGIQAWNSAETAVNRTVAAAERGDDPPSYFGVAPEWTCVRPVVRAGELSGAGPRLRAADPYLLFGVSGETAVLWDPVAGIPLKVPAAQVWLSPAGSGKSVCPEGS